MRAATSMRGRGRCRWAVVACAAMLLAVTGCGSAETRTLQDEAKDGSNKGYIAGDGNTEQIPPAQRNQPVTLSGTTLDGKPWAVADAKGTVVVLNLWASYCNPCKTEMPELQKVWSELSAAKAPVQFVGVNRDDSVDNARVEARAFALTYPSLAPDGGRALLALQGKATALPTTLVLDRQGRIAARVAGPVREATLRGLIGDAVAEGA